KSDKRLTKIIFKFKNIKLHSNIIIISVHQLPFMHAITTKLDVVSCVSPLFFFERWQMLFTFIEVYRHFGLDRQSIYVSSVLTNIMRILQQYEKHGYIELVPWTMLTKEDRDDRIDPNSEMSWRNQETAMNECLFKYKESASFILFIDIDEILIPTTNSYFNDFQLLTQSTNIASFAFQKLYLKTPTSEYLFMKFFRTNRITQ
uniref:Glycosyltransferase family 92 protein n=1 Tax=Parascaris equorum TaxID=6256 RepID=A0A914R736_PAREQ